MSKQGYFPNYFHMPSKPRLKPLNILDHEINFITKEIELTFVDSSLTEKNY